MIVVELGGQTYKMKKLGMRALMRLTAVFRGREVDEEKLAQVALKLLHEHLVEPKLTPEQIDELGVTGLVLFNKLLEGSGLTEEKLRELELFR